jgi:hypothetical protein
MKPQNNQNAIAAATAFLTPYLAPFAEPELYEVDATTLTLRGFLNISTLPKPIRTDAKRVARTYPDTYFFIEACVSLTNAAPIYLLAYEEDTQWQRPLALPTLPITETTHMPLTLDQKLALVRSLASSVKDDLICELNNECLINPDSVQVTDNTRDMPAYARIEPYITLFAAYPNDCDVSGHFLPSQIDDAYDWENEVNANPTQYPDSYDPEYGVTHESIALAIAIDATTESHFRINLYLEDNANIVTYCMSYAVAMQIAETPFDFFAFVQGQVRARREGELPSGADVEWDYVPSVA